MIPGLSFFKKPLVVLAIGIGAIAASFYLGYDYSAQATRAELADQYAEDLRQLRLRWVESRATVTALEAQLAEDQSKVRYITKEVPKYVTPDKDEYCGPPVGIVGLLNGARNPDLPFTPAEPDAESRAASGISYTEQVEDTLDITGRYNRLMFKYNALINWIEDNYGPDERSGLRGSLERHSEVPQG